MRGPSPLLVVCGTRPEAIKLAPLVAELRARHHPVSVLATGQHPDLLPAMLRETGLLPDVTCSIAREGTSITALVAALLAALPPVIARVRPAALVVQGDTASTLAGALAGSLAGLPVVHVEAGLRTGHRAEPFPEEINRRQVTALATHHLAPTCAAAAALTREGVPADRVQMTGNTGIDAVAASARRLRADRRLTQALAHRHPWAIGRRPLVLATVHRRENGGARLDSIVAGLARIARSGQAEVAVPLHPSPAIAAAMRARLGTLESAHLLPPVDHATMVWLMRRARLLLTDSGGLQEEAPALRLRTLVLRRATERPEAIACGTARLAPLDARGLAAAARAALAEPRPPRAFPFGDGRASARIADALEEWGLLAARGRTAP